MNEMKSKGGRFTLCWREEEMSTHYSNYYRTDVAGPLAERLREVADAIDARKLSIEQADELVEKAIALAQATDETLREENSAKAKSNAELTLEVYENIHDPMIGLLGPGRWTVDAVDYSECTAKVTGENGTRDVDWSSVAAPRCMPEMGHVYDSKDVQEPKV